MTRDRQLVIVILLAFVLLLFLMSRSMWWVALDVGVRLDLWPVSTGGFDAYAFTETQSLANVILFYIWALSKPVTVGLLFLKNKLAIYTHIAGFVATLLDWVLLALNPHDDGSSFVVAVFTAESLLLVVLIRLLVLRYLK
jgi:hypothetical protein